MTTFRRVACGVLVTWSASVGAQGPPAAAPQAPQGRFGTSTSAVVVDVVARDKKGPVTNLTTADFQVFEDGVPQTILTFEKRAPQEGVSVQDAARGAGVGSGSSGGNGWPAVIALAWDRLTPESRSLAYKAASALLKSRQPNELVGVFIVDQALKTVEPYTTDREKLQVAIDKAAGTATSQTGREQNTMLEQRMPKASTPVTASAEHAGAAVPGMDPRSLPLTATGPVDPVENAIRNMLERMDNSYEQLLSDVQGKASMNALLALVDSLGELPGRKTVVYLCEGLTVAPSVEAQFQSIIATANRKNVAVYALDAAGLRVHSQQAATAQELTDLAKATITGVERDERKIWTTDLEKNEQLLKSDPSASLGMLTGQTGGLLIQNTNDLERGIARIDDDRRFYYLLTYSPSNAALDGTYRRIEVKSTRPGIELHSRAGYMAVPANAGGPTLTYEAPAIAALSATPRPTAFPVQLTALSVPMPSHLGLTALIAGISGTAVTFIEDAKAGTYAGQATILARVSDESGAPVRKASQQYQLAGKSDQLPRVRSGGLLFYRTVDLPPGRFTVDAAAYDEKGKRSAVASTNVEVPSSGPAVGTLFVIARVEKLEPGAPDSASHPLASQGLLLYPSFGEPISRKAQAELAFALPLVLDPAAPASSANLELLEAGKPLASIPLPLDKPDAQGRLLQVSRLPTSAIPPGTYELRVTVTAGANKIQRTAAVTLVD